MPTRRDAGTTWRSLLRRGTLGRRILLWLLALSLVPLLLSSTLGYLVSRRILEGQARQFLGAIAETQAEHVAHEMERHRLGLEALIASSRSLERPLEPAAEAMRRGIADVPDARELETLLREKLNASSAFDEFAILGPFGHLLASTEERRRGVDWSEERFFTAARTHPVITEWWEGERPAYVFAIPVLADDGTRKGVFVAMTQPENRGRLLEVPAKIAGFVETYIVSEHGRPLFASDPEFPLDLPDPLPSPLTGARPGSTLAYVNHRGVEVVASSARISGLSWLSISEAPVEAVFGQLRELRFLAGLIEGLFALFLVAVVWVTARSIVTPVRQLVAGADRIREGQLGVQVAVNRDDELGQLGRTFNQMSRELEKSASQIRELHDQELRRAAQLASVGELASGIAHEIKNPVAGIASGVGLLVARSGEDAQTEGIASQIRNQLRRIESAISDLLSYAKPKQPRVLPVDPVELVDRALALIRPQADAAGLRVDARVRVSPVTVEADPEQLTQALINLLLNGMQAMTDPGDLVVSVDQEDEEVRIGVSDTGIGIPEDMIQEIFRPFVTTKHRGTGLGLAITRGIVERNGGRIEVESRLGEGSRFTIVLPLSAPEVLA